MQPHTNSPAPGTRLRAPGRMVGIGRGVESGTTFEPYPADTGASYVTELQLGLRVGLRGWRSER